MSTTSNLFFSDNAVINREFAFLFKSWQQLLRKDRYEFEDHRDLLTLFQTTGMLGAHTGPFVQAILDLMTEYTKDIKFDKNGPLAHRDAYKPLYQRAIRETVLDSEVLKPVVKSAFLIHGTQALGHLFSIYGFMREF